MNIFVGLGKKRASYKLDNVAEIELGVKKLEYASEGMTLDRFYENDPLNYLLYNLIDVTLCVKLDDKLQMIDLYNLIRRSMKTPLSTALRGSSPLFENYVYCKLAEEGKYVRNAIKDETSFGIQDWEVQKTPTAMTLERKLKWDKVEKISARDVQRVISKFPGAFKISAFIG